MAGPDWLGFITCYFQGKKFLERILDLITDGDQTLKLVKSDLLIL